MSELPEGWAAVELNELIDEIVGGGTPSKSDPGNFEGSVPFMTVKDMNTPRPNTTVDHISEHAVATSSTNVVPEDTLVIATRIGLGKVVRPVIPVAINQDLKAIFHNDAVQHDFLERWFQRHTRTIQSLGKGTTVKGITLPVLRSLPVTLPPYEEQKRIAAKIESLTAKSARTRTELTKIETLVERYKAAILSAVFSGTLSPPGHPMTSHALEELIDEGPKNGVSPKPSNAPDAPTSLKLSATSTGDMVLNDATTKQVDIQLDHSSKYWLKDGDILVQRANSLKYLGATARYAGEAHKYIYPDLMMRIRPKFDVDGEYLWRFLNSTAARSYFQENATGTAGNMPKINGSILRNLNVPIPHDVDEQKRLAAIVRSAFHRIDRVRAEAIAGLTKVNALDRCILAQAFRGDLVPQDPTDEPAETLLERIRELGSQAMKKRVGRRKSKSNRETPVDEGSTKVLTDTPPQNHLSSLIEKTPGISNEALWKRSGLDIEAFFKQARREAELGLLPAARLENGGTL
jgi:type I restriction enzyme S subunit